ncbi:hypothetical protein niasHT_007427 [Heterodera trifolii]|uniref:Uncharacterized protein n=1 Tax=Heterodera trifolii TaxID=157864 RepID=A0ABD2LMK3_9BILA
MVRSFVNYSCRNNCCNNASETESPSNLLVIFTDPDDPESEEPMQYIFCEALRIASCNNNVHWIRAKPAMRTPNTPSDCVLRPNDLARIHLHYGFDALPSLIRLFCTKTLFVNAITCSALFFVAFHQFRMCQSVGTALHGRQLDVHSPTFPPTTFPSGRCAARLAPTLSNCFDVLFAHSSMAKRHRLDGLNCI